MLRAPHFAKISLLKKKNDYLETVSVTLPSEFLKIVAALVWFNPIKDCPLICKEDRNIHFKKQGIYIDYFTVCKMGQLEHREAKGNHVCQNTSMSDVFFFLFLLKSLQSE